MQAKIFNSATTMWFAATKMGTKTQNVFVNRSLQEYNYYTVVTDSLK